MIPSGRILAGFPGLSLPDEIRALAQARALAGVVLFRRNIDSDEQLLALVEQIHRAFEGQQTPIIAVDQEGGRVQRLVEPKVAVAPIPAMRALGDYLDFRGFEQLGAIVGQGLRRYGVNLDFAPVLDVDTNPKNPIIGDRAFGRTPDEVSLRALAFGRGLEKAGVMWCGKHFPGHGDTSVDSHLELPTLPHERSRLDAVELPPFRAAVQAGAPMIMTAHIVFSALDAERPATLSPRVVPEILRAELGYDGVVATDDLEMKAIRDHFGVDQIAASLDAADVDLALVCSDLSFASELSARLAPRESATRRISALRERLISRAG
ncbi:MAG TPA: beta-N-acetylhexosaminidase [Myxococcota bacterium]|nr:beta-N-acetylhexosaminidase [Myxococcota bacterium]